MTKYIEAKGLYEALYDADAITFRGMEMVSDMRSKDGGMKL